MFGCWVLPCEQPSSPIASSCRRHGEWRSSASRCGATRPLSGRPAVVAGRWGVQVNRDLMTSLQHGICGPQGPHEGGTRLGRLPSKSRQGRRRCGRGEAALVGRFSRVEWQSAGYGDGSCGKVLPEDARLPLVFEASESRPQFTNRIDLKPLAGRVRHLHQMGSPPGPRCPANPSRTDLARPWPHAHLRVYT